MKNLSFLKHCILIGVLCLSVNSIQAQEPAFPIPAEETKMLADFFKQPSAVEGKINAEVLGIDINRDGFNWDDIYTWRNSAGELFQKNDKSKPSASFGLTVWGVGINNNNDYKGCVSVIIWTTNQDDYKWGYIVPGCKDLAGSFVMTTKADGLQIAGTQIESIKLTCTQTTITTYYKIRRNGKLKTLDLSGSTGKLAQLEGYSNALESFILNDVDSKALTAGSSIKGNSFKISTMPLLPNGSLFGYYDDQKPVVIGQKDGNNSYELEYGEEVDLSTEYMVRGQNTIYQWKDMATGDNITPSLADRGVFTFSDDFIDKTIVCEMTHPVFPSLILKTVPVKVVENYSTGIYRNSMNNTIRFYPNPVKDNLYLSGENIQNIKIFSLSGVCVSDIDYPAQVIHVDYLNKGSYLVQITSPAGKIIQKMIKE